MTNQQISKLLKQALHSSNTDGSCYDIVKLVIQIELIISMLEDDKPVKLMRDNKDIGDIK